MRTLTLVLVGLFVTGMFASSLAAAQSGAIGNAPTQCQAGVCVNPNCFYCDFDLGVVVTSGADKVDIYTDLLGFFLGGSLGNWVRVTAGGHFVNVYQNAGNADVCVDGSCVA